MKTDSSKISIVVSLFNEKITRALLDSCLGTLEEQTGQARDSFTVVHVPGAFEIPSVCKALAEKPQVECVIAIGCVIRGDTPHFDYISKEVTRGLMDVSLYAGKPIIMGVLTTNTEAQALERCHLAAIKAQDCESQHTVKPLPSDKGTEFALAALQMVDVFKGDL